MQVSHSGVGENRNESQTRRSEARLRKTAYHVVVNYVAEGPEHLPRTNDHEVAQCRVVALEVPEANFGAASYHKVVLEETTSEDREQRQNRGQKSQWWKEVSERGKARLPKRGTEAKNLDDDEQKIYENFTQLNKLTKTCQDARRAQPPAGEKGIPNSR